MINLQPLLKLKNEISRNSYGLLRDCENELAQQYNMRRAHHINQLGELINLTDEQKVWAEIILTEWGNDVRQIEQESRAIKEIKGRMI